MTGPIRAPFGVVALFGLNAIGCAKATPSVATTLSCIAADSVAAPGVTTDSLAGKYRIVATAVAGKRAGASTQGTMTLSPFPSPGRADAAIGTPYATRFPIYGSTTIVPDSVGAAAGGEVMSNDPTAPGILVLDSGSGEARSIMLRLGSDANRETPVPFDGSHFVLMVRGARGGRLTGAWRSGTAGSGPLSQASGYFCAERTP